MIALELTEATVVAVISASALVLAAALPGFLWLVRTARSTRDAVGEPTSRGDLVTMLVKLLDGQTGQDRRLASLEGGQMETNRRLSGVEARVALLERIETAHDETDALGREGRLERRKEET